MPIIEHVWPWDSQPQEVTELSSDGLGGLVTEFINAGVGVPFAGRQRQIGTLSSGGIGRSYANNALGFTGGSSRSANFPMAPRWCDGSSDFSVEILFTYQSAGAQFDRLLDTANGGATSSGGWDLELGGGGNFVRFAGWNGNALSVFDASPTLTAGQLCHVVVTRQGTNCVSYFNGVQHASSGAIVISTSNMATIRLLAYTTGGANSPSGYAVHLARFYQGRQLSSGQVAELYRRPWQLFEPRRIFVPMAGAPSGIPTLSAATVFNITATTARPRVVVTF